MTAIAHRCYSTCRPTLAVTISERGKRIRERRIIHGDWVKQSIAYSRKKWHPARRVRFFTYKFGICRARCVFLRAESAPGVLGAFFCKQNWHPARQMPILPDKIRHSPHELYFSNSKKHNEHRKCRGRSKYKGSRRYFGTILTWQRQLTAQMKVTILDKGKKKTGSFTSLSQRHRFAKP